MRELTNDDAVPPPADVLAEARRVLAEREGVDHDHRGPGPCPVCGAVPSDDAPATSWHPTERFVPVLQRIDETEENE